MVYPLADAAPDWAVLRISKRPGRLGGTALTTRRLTGFRQQNGLLQRQSAEDPVRRPSDVRRRLFLGDGLRVGDAEGLAMAAHLPATGGVQVLQPVAVWAVSQQDRHARLPVDVGVEHRQRGAVGRAGFPSGVLEDAEGRGPAGPNPLDRVRV